MAAQLLTDPFLQNPTANSVQVVWFTEFAGDRHVVHYGEALDQSAIATTTQLTRTREDAQSHLARMVKVTLSPDGAPAAVTAPGPVLRPIWRHEARISPLPANQRLPYQVSSTDATGETVRSGIFSLGASPSPGTPLKLLLTSDHQLKPLTTANLQKVVETVGPVDGVLFAGDLVDVPDRASEWFDDARGGAFFPALQGRAQYQLEKNGKTTVYKGGALIQSAPLFTALGNHEVMGRFSTTTGLHEQFNDPVPQAAAQAAYGNAPAPADWLKDHAFNSDTYEQIFSLPESPTGGKKYYATTFGDVRLVVLYATTIWRSPAAKTRGRYQERSPDLADPQKWGHGHFLFEAIAPGSPQFTWLQQEVRSAAWQRAKYKVVMLHHPPHSLGINSVPAYTDPVQKIEHDTQGAITAIRYTYPKAQDYLLRDVMPLVEKAGANLVFYGHSHLWNRFVSPAGTHFLETSNVGNSYGAYWGDGPQDPQRQVIASADHPAADYPAADYPARGNPGGLPPVVPTIAPLWDAQDRPQPYIASNDITVFSILDTGTGTVSSYRFDTGEPGSRVVKFDAFELKNLRRL